MKMTIAGILALSVVGLGFVGCTMVDESAPTRPRVKALDVQGEQNAEKRALEAPNRSMPTGGPEFPGQSNADIKTSASSSPSVLTLSDGYGDSTAAKIPQLAEKPGTTPAVGFTPVAGTPWVIDYSWGEGLPLESYNHRAWPDTKTNYVIAAVKGNPTYDYVTAVTDQISPMKCPEGTDAVKTLVGVPWFYCNAVALPVLMCFECPWKQVTNSRLGQDPLYFGYLPKSGGIVPSPQPGEFIFEYDFMTREGAEIKPK